MEKLCFGLLRSNFNLPIQRWPTLFSYCVIYSSPPVPLTIWCSRWTMVLGSGSQRMEPYFTYIFPDRGLAIYSTEQEEQKHGRSTARGEHCLTIIATTTTSRRVGRLSWKSHHHRSGDREGKLIPHRDDGTGATVRVGNCSSRVGT